MSKGYNLPDNVSPTDPDAPWNQDDVEDVSEREVVYLLHMWRCPQCDTLQVWEDEDDTESECLRCGKHVRRTYA